MAIDIKVGKFRLTNDDRQFIVSHQYKRKSGANVGMQMEIDHTYHPTIEQAFQNILKRKLMASKAKTLKELIVFLKKQNKMISKLFNQTLKKEEKCPTKFVKE